MAARIGRSVSPSTCESTVTPTTAPTHPGMASWRTSRWSMLRNRQWEMAEAMPVATLAMLTVLETDAGLRPAPSRMLELVGPKPMPSAPSTSEAQNPARATSKSSSMDDFSHRQLQKGLPGAPR